MNLPAKVAVKGKGIVTLNKNSYVAAGGQGTVCQQGGIAYKIYHDPKHMIPVPKIEELKALKQLPNVLGPQEILLDPKNNKPIGFTMPFVSKTEFLCRLFNSNFKSDNNINPDTIIELVKCLQTTLSEIHKERILVVDLNEMNFLSDLNYTLAYFIDVDSYQTTSYKAAALMETVRDRQAPPGQFTKLTDWFSFAIVAFQLYMGYHPYRKGKHPKYKAKDWSERMDKNISIFHPDISLADNWKNWDVIPQPHFEWFKRVFHNKERSIPPLPEGIVLVSIQKPIMITGTDKFEVKLIHKYDDDILRLYFFNGIQYVVTKKSVYKNISKWHIFKKTPKRFSMGLVIGDEPVKATLSDNMLYFNDGDIGKIAANAAMHYNGAIYSIYNNNLIETTFKKSPVKTLMINKNVCNIFSPATKLYSGVAVQDILNTCWLAIPYAQKCCVNVHVKELDGQRIIDAKYENGICILISEKDGIYKRIVLCFKALSSENYRNDDITAYTIRIDEDIIYNGINFTTLKNGVCINILNDDSIEIFQDNTKIKVIQDPPFKTNNRLFNDGTSVYFISQNSLYNVRLK